MGSSARAFAFLVETAFQLYLVALMLRVLLEAVRANYYNPVCQVLIKVTDPLIRPLKKVIPSAGSINLAGIVWLLVIELVLLVLLAALGAWALKPGLLLILAIKRLLRMLLVLYMVLIIAGVVLSWIGHSFRHPIVPLIFQLSEPVLAPVRRLLPTLGGLDFSPLITLVAIQFFIILLGL